MENKGIYKAVVIIAKIIEVFMWVGAALCAVLTVVTFIGRQDLYHFLMSADAGASSINMQGFELTAAAGVALSPAAFIVVFITGIIICSLMAMIARNIYLIFKTAAGQTKFSKGATPFQPDVVRMVREIGIFAIAIPIVELVMSAIAGVVLGFNTIELSADVTSIFFGLVALALTQFFAYGASLQNEVDGLV